MSNLINMFAEMAGVDPGARGPRGLSAFGLSGFADVNDSGMVRKGDTVLAVFNANAAYQLDPFAQPDRMLQTRLQTAGFQVVRIDASAISSLGSVFGGGSGDVLVTVKPITSDYANAYDVASVVAGAASASGFNVDFNTVRGSIVARAQGQTLPGYDQIQNDPNKTSQKDYFQEFADTLNLSKSTLTIGAIGIAALVLFVMVKK